jgi:hypothetical protein
VAAGHREAGAAEVEQEHRVVVDLERDGFLAPAPLRDADARHRGHPLGGAEDAGQGVEDVDGHVAQGAAVGSVVPRGVDRGQDVLAPPGRLVVVPAAGVAPGPVDVAEGAPVDQPLHGAVGGVQHLAGRGDKGQAALPGRLDHLPRVGIGRRHRLLDVDVLAGPQGVHRVGVVEPDRGDDQDQLDVVAGDQVGGVVEVVGDAVLGGRFAGALADHVADGDEFDPLLGVGQRQLRQDADQRQAAAADQTDPDLACGPCVFSLPPTPRARRASRRVCR